MFNMLWYDYYYIILVVPALIISAICQFSVKSTYSKMASIPSKRGLSGAEAAERVLRHYGINNVKIEMTSGTLSDHYDPRTNVIRLSKDVFYGTSIASIGIASHEAGHAAQHAENYLPIKIRNAILPVANFGSSTGFLIAIIGYFLGYPLLTNIGVVLFAFVALFQLATLPVEFNASSRAMKVIGETELLFEDEKPKARRMLASAAMTYVASLLVSIMSLLRLFLRTRNRRD